MFRIIVVIVFMFANIFCSPAQIDSLGHRNIKSDFIPHIELNEIVVERKSPRKVRRFNRKMERLEYNVRIAYPYACIAAEKITEIENKLSHIQNNKESKQLIQKEYKELMRTFKKPLMKLTISQGRILIRLIYRETNASSFAHIKEYKGGFNAQFWQTLARLFGNNLKSTYDPDGEDAEIEKIVIKINEEHLLFRNFVE